MLVGGVASNGAAATVPSTTARAPLALGDGWGDRTVDPLFAVLKSPATGGKRSASATLTPALTVLPDSTSRYSIPFFYNASREAIIECLPTCVSAERPALFEPDSAENILQDRYSQAFNKK